MVGHEHVGVEGGVGVCQCVTQPAEIGVVIVVAEEARFAVVPSLHEVQGYIAQMKAGSTRHGVALAKRGQ